MVTQQQEQILKRIFDRFYVRWKKDTHQDVLRIGTKILKRNAMGFCGTEATMPEEKVYKLLVKLGAAKTRQEAENLAPNLDGFIMDYTPFHILRIDKTGFRLLGETVRYNFRRILRDTNTRY